MEIEEHVPLGAKTTFRVGGSAHYYGIAQSIHDIEEALDFADKRAAGVVYMGGGSNMLLDDGEADALFLQVDVRGIAVEGNTIVAGAGESWDDIVARAVAEKRYGIENLSGIPGTVGGALVQNIGAYGAALSQHVSWIEVYDREEKKLIRFEGSACQFGYRDSIFKQNIYRYILVRAGFRLQSEKKLDTSYKDLAERFKDSDPTLEGMRAAVLMIRGEKFPDLTREGTAGSFFKNPIVSVQEGERLRKTYPRLPLFSIPEATGIKLPLAWLLDHVLNLRGFKMGPVRCFEKQPLVLVASRGASARDVRALAHHVTKRMEEEIGIRIEPEVCVMHGAAIARTLDF